MVPIGDYGWQAAESLICRSTMSAPRHSLFRRLSWHPVVAAVPLAFLLYRATNHGVTVIRGIGLAIVSIWLVLAIIDATTDHRFLNWLYSEDDADGGAEE